MMTLAKQQAKPRARLVAPTRGRAGAGLVTAAVLLTLAYGTAGYAMADVRVPSGCSVIIEHGNANGGSQTRIIRYPDGHKVITQDGHNTDITIQRQPGSELHGYGWSPPYDENSRFHPPSMQERFRSGPGNEMTERFEAGSAREAFRRRMLDRIGGYR